MLSKFDSICHNHGVAQWCSGAAGGKKVLGSTQASFHIHPKPGRVFSPGAAAPSPHWMDGWMDRPHNF